MPYNVIIKDGAKIDIKEAYQYYEDQLSGLGERFLSELQKRFISIALHPEYYSFIDERQVLRDVVLDKFPYLVVFAISESDVKVYAVCHMHRNFNSKNIE